MALRRDTESRIYVGFQIYIQYIRLIVRPRACIHMLRVSRQVRSMSMNNEVTGLESWFCPKEYLAVAVLFDTCARDAVDLASF